MNTHIFKKKHLFIESIRVSEPALFFFEIIMDKKYKYKYKLFWLSSVLDSTYFLLSAVPDSSQLDSA